MKLTKINESVIELILKKNKLIYNLDNLTSEELKQLEFIIIEELKLLEDLKPGLKRLLSRIKNKNSKYNFRKTFRSLYPIIGKDISTIFRIYSNSI